MLLDQDCVTANPHSDKVILGPEPYYYLTGNMNFQAGYDFTLCFKCENEQGGSHTRLLKF